MAEQETFMDAVFAAYEGAKEGPVVVPTTYTKDSPACKRLMEVTGQTRQAIRQMLINAGYEP